MGIKIQQHNKLRCFAVKIAYNELGIVAQLDSSLFDVPVHTLFL